MPTVIGVTKNYHLVRRASGDGTAAGRASAGRGNGVLARHDAGGPKVSPPPRVLGRCRACGAWLGPARPRAALSAALTAGRSAGCQGARSVLGLAWAWGHTWALGAATHHRRAPWARHVPPGCWASDLRMGGGRWSTVQPCLFFTVLCNCKCVNAYKPLILLVW
jgi:hypothetical protein